MSEWEILKIASNICICANKAKLCNVFFFWNSSEIWHDISSKSDQKIKNKCCFFNEFLYIWAIFLFKMEIYKESMLFDSICDKSWRKFIMTSSNENVFRLTGPLWGESTGHQWIPLAKASNAELWYLLRSAPKQTAQQTIETPVIWDAITLIMTSLKCLRYFTSPYSTNQPCISWFMCLFFSENFLSLIRSEPYILRQLRRGPHTRTSHGYLRLIQLETWRQAVVTAVGIARPGLRERKRGTGREEKIEKVGAKDWGGERKTIW